MEEKTVCSVCEYDNKRPDEDPCIACDDRASMWRRKDTISFTRDEAKTVRDSLAYIESEVRTEAESNILEKILMFLDQKPACNDSLQVHESKKRCVTCEHGEELGTSGRCQRNNFMDMNARAWRHSACGNYRYWEPKESKTGIICYHWNIVSDSCCKGYNNCRGNGCSDWYAPSAITVQATREKIQEFKQEIERKPENCVYGQDLIDCGCGYKTCKSKRCSKSILAIEAFSDITGRTILYCGTCSFFKSIHDLTDKERLAAFPVFKQNDFKNLSPFWELEQTAVFVSGICPCCERQMPDIQKNHVSNLGIIKDRCGACRNKYGNASDYKINQMRESGAL